MRVLLDTVTFLRAATSPGQVSRRAMSLLRSESTTREISVVSAVEIAAKHAKGKLRFGKEEWSDALDALRLEVLPFTAEHAYRMFQLPAHHADPFDRQIIAQALCEDIPVVTCDETFGMYEGLKIVW